MEQTYHLYQVGICLSRLMLNFDQLKKEMPWVLTFKTLCHRKAVHNLIDKCVCVCV